MIVTAFHHLRCGRRPKVHQRRRGDVACKTPAIPDRGRRQDNSGRVHSLDYVKNFCSEWMAEQKEWRFPRQLRDGAHVKSGHSELVLEDIEHTIKHSVTVRTGQLLSKVFDLLRV